MVNEIQSPEAPYECSCGEWFRTIEAAKRCRKCRTYAPNEWCEDVWDRRSQEYVWQAFPVPPKPKAYVQEPWAQPTLADLL